MTIALFAAANIASAADGGLQTGCEQAHRSGDAQAVAQYCQFAQHHGRHHRDDDGPGAPTGSFVESCRNTQQKGWTVYSGCRDRMGNRSRTSINFRSCSYYSLEKLNGNLVCGR